MDRRTALVRLTRAATQDMIPLAQRLLRGARRTADDVLQKTLGPDFDDRVGYLRQRYSERGADPFGLDAETARHALTC